MAITARVSSWDPVTMTALVEGFPQPVPYARHVTPTLPGDTVVVSSSGAGQAWIVGCLGEAPTQAVEPVQGGAAPFQPLPTQETVSLRPTWSGTWRNGWRSDTSDLYQGDWTGRGVNTGACWWGGLPSTMVGASVRLVRNAEAGPGGAVAPTMTLLPGVARPSYLPTPLATAPGPSLGRGQTVVWTVPAEWVEKMRAGEAGGIGITSGGSPAPYLGLVVSEAGMTLTVREST